MALGTIYDRHAPAIYAYACALLDGDEEAVETVVLDLFAAISRGTLASRPVSVRNLLLAETGRRALHSRRSSAIHH